MSDADPRAFPHPRPHPPGPGPGGLQGLDRSRAAQPLDVDPRKRHHLLGGRRAGRRPLPHGNQDPRRPGARNHRRLSGAGAGPAARPDLDLPGPHPRLHRQGDPADRGAPGARPRPHRADPQARAPPRRDLPRLRHQGVDRPARQPGGTVRGRAGGAGGGVTRPPTSLPKAEGSTRSAERASYSAVRVNQTAVGSDYFAVWLNQTAVWLSHFAVWLDYSAVWLDQTAVGSNHSAVWADHSAVWTSHSAVWTNPSAFRADPSAVWANDSAIWADPSAVWS